MLKRSALALALLLSPCLAAKEHAHNRLAGRGQVRRVPLSFGGAGSRPALASKKPPQLPVADKSLHTAFGDFLFTEMAETGPVSSRRLAGTIVNNTTRIWYNPAFDFHFQSSVGSPLNCAQCEITTTGAFAPGQRIVFGREPTSEPFGILVSAELGPNHRLSSITLGSPSFYSADYFFSLIDPQSGPSLRYEDSNFTFVFLPGYKGVQVTLHNKTGQEAILDWNGASMIGMGGQTMPVAHGGLKITDPSADKPPSSIAPNATFEDTVTPISSLRFDNQAWGPGNWLPYAPIASNYRGGTFGLVLPVSVAGSSKKYTFRFRIDDVR